MSCRDRRRAFNLAFWLERKEFITIRVQEPFLHNRDSWRPYISYEIFLHTNSISFTRKTSRVRRRFSEFVWLRQKMMKNASMITVPRLPPKDLFFNCWCDDEIEERRKGLQTFLNKVVEIAPLLADSLLHLFLQSALSRQEMEGCAMGRTPYSVSQAVRFRCGVPGHDGDDGEGGATVAIVPLKKWQVLEYGDWFVIEELEPFEFPPSHPLEVVEEEEEQEEKKQEKEVEEEEEERDEAIEDDDEDDEDGTAVPIVKKRSTQKDRSASSCSSGVSVDSVSSSCSPPALPGGGEATTRRVALGLQPREENVGGDGDGGDDDYNGGGSGNGDIGDGGDVSNVGDSSDGGDVADVGDGGDDGEVGDVGKSDGGNGDMGNVGNSDGGGNDDDNNGGGSGNGDIGDGGDVSNVGDSSGDNDGDADGSEPAESSPENRDHGESVDTSDSAVSGNAASLL
ncbi:unnamed protein product [Lampetra planeri]